MPASALGISATVRQAKFRGGQVRLERLDKVILAGGSSALPFLRDLVRKTFGALREEFRSMCVGFNEAYGRHFYKAGIQDFDAIPFEKYEDLLRRKPASKTWFMGLDVHTDLKAERFVFWFHPMSQAFAKHARAAFPKGTTLPPADVTLTISRRVDGEYRVLTTEPIRLRELGYTAGSWLFLFSEPNGAVEAKKLNAEEATNMFLQDVLVTFF